MKRENVATVHETAMKYAETAALRSKDPSTQVGACVLNKRDRVLSTGYNGAPNGYDDNLFPWGKDDDNPTQNKYLYVIHAEANAVLSYDGSLRDFVGASIYSTLFPCNECAKIIAQVGITTIYYKDSPDFTRDIYTASLKLLRAVGIAVIQINNVDNLGVDETA